MYIAIIYILIAFVVHFYMYKKHWSSLREKMEDYHNDCWLDTREGWFICIIPLFWIVAMPALFMWYVMEIIYSKLNNKK